MTNVVFDITLKLNNKNKIWAEQRKLEIRGLLFKNQTMRTGSFDFIDIDIVRNNEIASSRADFSKNITFLTTNLDIFKSLKFSYWLISWWDSADAGGEEAAAAAAGALAAATAWPASGTVTFFQSSPGKTMRPIKDPTWTGLSNGAYFKYLLHAVA